VRLDDDGGPAHLVAGPELVAGVDGGVVLAPARIEAGVARRRGQGSGCRRVDGLENFARRRPPRPIRLDDDLLRLVDEAEARLVGGSEGLLHLGEAAERHDQRGIGSGVTHMGAHMRGDVRCCDALAGDLAAGIGAETLAQIGERRQRGLAERLLDRLLAGRPDVGEPHAVGGEQRREGMDQNFRHAERVGHQAGMLAAGAAEAVERIARHVIAALHRNLLNRVCHVLDRDLDEAVGNLLGRAAVADLRARAPRRRS